MNGDGLGRPGPACHTQTAPDTREKLWDGDPWTRRQGTPEHLRYLVAEAPPRPGPLGADSPDERDEGHGEAN